jgi:hypothetical protein
MSTETPSPAGNAPQQVPQAPQAEPKKKGVVARILTSIVAFLVIGAGAYAFNYFTSDAAQTKAGDCASLTGSASSPEFETVKCDSDKANYSVGKVLQSAGDNCGGTYDEYVETARRGPDSKLCLVPNFAEGSCYEVDGSSDMGYPKADCNKTGAVKVTKVVKGSDDESACGELGAFAFPEPKITFCVEPVQGS